MRNPLFVMVYRHVLAHGTKEECNIVMTCQERGDIAGLTDTLRDIRNQRLSEVK